MRVLDPIKVIDGFYAENPKLREILVKHSTSVADKAVSLSRRHPELQLDEIIKTNAPEIYCFGDKPYICHGYLGAEMLRGLGYDRHALVCERHTGAGISKEDVKIRNLPLPLRDFMPLSKEEITICFADKFFSKTKLLREKTVEQAIVSLSKYGNKGVERFKEWCKMFE